MSETIYAQVDKDVVVNVVVADPEWVAKQDGQWIAVAKSESASIGWNVVNGMIVKPPPPPPPAEIPKSPDYLSAIDKLSKLGLTKGEIIAFREGK